MAKPTSWSFSTASIDTANWGWFWSGSTWCLPIWEGSGTTLNSIGSFNNPMYFGATTAAPTWSTDANGVTLAFDGANDTCYESASYPPASGLNGMMQASSGSWTIYWVVTPGSLTGYQQVIGDGIGGSVGSMYPRINQTTNYWNSEIRCTDGTAGGTISDTVAAVSGTLYVNIMTYDHANKLVQMYKNGQPVNTALNIGGKTIKAGGRVYLGSVGSDLNSFWRGNISMVGKQAGLWSSASIAQFYANPWGPITQYIAPTSAVNRVITGTQNNAIFAPTDGSPCIYTFGG